MIKCKNCGNEIDEEYVTMCYICETDIYEQTEICEFCGKEVPTDQLLCDCLKDL